MLLHQSDRQEALLTSSATRNIYRAMQRCEQRVNGCSWVLQVNVKPLIDSRATSSSFIFTSPESLIDGGCLCFIRKETKCGEEAGRAALRRHSGCRRCRRLPRGLVRGSHCRPSRDPFKPVWRRNVMKVTVP